MPEAVATPRQAGYHAAQRKAARKELRHVTRLLFIASCIHASAQVTYLSSVAAFTSEWCHRVGSIVFVVFAWVFPTVAPLTAWHWKQTFLVSLRVVFFMFPLLRSNVGIQRSLEALPTPGPLGCALDLLKLVWGCRLMAVMFVALAVPVPLLLHLLLTCYSTLMLRNNSSICGMPLLTSGVTAGRVPAFHTWASRLSLAGLSGFALAPPADPGQRLHQCEALLNILHALCGVLLPTVFLVLSEVTQANHNWCGAAVERLEGGVRYWCGGAFSPARGGGGGVAAAAEPGGLRSEAARLAVVWWLALSLVWVVSVGAAPGPSSLPPL